MFAACSWADDEVSQPAAAGQQPAAPSPTEPDRADGPAAQTEQREQAAADTDAGEAQQQVSAAADQAEEPAPQEPTQADPDAPFHPDTADLTQLVFWGPLDGYFGLRLRIPTRSRG